MWRAVVAGWLCAVFLGVELSAAEPQFDAERLARIPQRMEEFVRAGRISGAVTLVATPDRIVHLEAVGQADLAAQRPLRTDAIFRIASMTKLVTATALLMQVEAGKLAIDDPIARHLPVFADQKLADGGTARPVTVADVLTHTAGLAAARGAEIEGMTLEQVVAFIGRKPLAFPPGSKWEYSSGLTVAGRLIEVTSGQSYADFLRERIFEPLGMRDTAFRLTPEQAARLAVTYKPGAAPGALAAVDLPDPTIDRTPNPSGGLYSTAADMALFYQAILRGGVRDQVRLLNPTTVAEMIRPRTPGIVTGFTPGNAWGLGWCVVERPQGVTRLLSPGTHGHGGAWGTQGWIDPARGLIFILMIQRTGFGNSDGSEIRDAFTELAIQAHRGAETPHAKFGAGHGFAQTVELTRGDVRAVLCPEAGGRVLEFSQAGKDALYREEPPAAADAKRPRSMDAGRFDFGPELTTAAHPLLWSGEWTAEITGPSAARLISQRDAASGVQLIRDFELRGETPGARAPCLSCRQTIINVSTVVREYCHWGRSFSPGGGVCLVPLAGRSRFPSQYAMYEDAAIINVRNTDERMRVRDGFVEILGPPRKPKLGFDSYAGWLAYALPNDLLFVKRFPTYPDRVYNEAAGLTLSVWYPTGPRIELEPIGPRERLQPGEAASFTEDWWLLSGPLPKRGESLDLPALRDRVLRLTAAP